MSKTISEFVQQHERNANKNIYGYPKAFISELLELTVNINKEKKKWQRLANDRKLLLEKIETMIGVNKVLGTLNGEGEKDGFE